MCLNTPATIEMYVHLQVGVKPWDDTTLTCVICLLTYKCQILSEQISHLLVGDGVGHVGWIDHGRDSAQESHRSVDQSEVAPLVLQ